MLGERLGESSGKFTGIRVLPSEGGQVWLEVSFQGRGTLLGQEISDLGTYRQTFHPEGVLSGEGHVVIMSDAGDVADWVGGGVGRQTGPGYQASFGTFGSCSAATGALSQLASVADVIEYEVEEDPDVARRQLEERVAAVAAADPFLRDHPPVVTWSGGQFAGGQLFPGHPLRELVLQAHADVAGQERLRERGAPYGSDLRLYAEAGIPTLHYGPGDVRLAHGPDEAVDLDEVVRVTEALVLAVLRSCGTAG